LRVNCDSLSEKCLSLHLKVDRKSTVKLLLNAGSRINAGSLIYAGVLSNKHRVLIKAKSQINAGVF